MADYICKKGDTGIPVAATLSDENGVVNLTGYTVTVNMRKVGSTENTITGGACSIVSAPAGTVTYTFAAGDVDETGLYNLEFVATSGANIIHFPRAAGQAAFKTVEIVDALD